MASVYHLFDDAVHTEDDIVDKYKDHGKEARRLHFAAVKIQSAYRGYLVRKEMKRLNRLATVIQKTFRGWLVRYHLPDVLHEYYDRMLLNCYSYMATKIQALWRGYTVRKTCCIKDIMQKRAMILEANAKMEKALKEQQKKNFVLKQKVNVEKILTVLFDRHHLLRTQQSEGVLSKHDCKELTELEKFLESMQWKKYMIKLREIYYTFNKEKEEFDRKFVRKYAENVDDKSCLRKGPKTTTVPNIDDRNIHEKPFNLTSKLYEKPYDQMVTTTGKYSVVTKDVARSEDRSKFICDKDFNIYTLKKVANEADVPPYYIDIWFEKCRIHNLP